MQSQITLLERYDRMLEEMKQKVGIEIKATALNSYFTIRKHLRAFVEEKFHTSDIAFGLIEEDFLDCLQHYSVGKLGHSSIASTQIYAQVTDQKIAKDMEKLMQHENT